MGRFALTSSLRSGYRYAFIRQPSVDAAPLVVNSRLMCISHGGLWSDFITGTHTRSAAGVDALARSAIRTSLVHAGRISAAGSDTRPSSAAAMERRTHAAAGILAGRMEVPLQFLRMDEEGPWVPQAATNAQWAAVLDRTSLWPCFETPAEHPSCLQGFITRSARQLQSRLAQWLHPPHLRGGDGPAIGGQGGQGDGRGRGGQKSMSVLWGHDAGGNAFAWNTSDSCLQCLVGGTSDGLFFMWRPAWLLRHPIARSSDGKLAGRMSAPRGLLSHWRCSAGQQGGRRMQCALPVWPSADSMLHTTRHGSGDEVQCLGNSCIELLNRTAFISNPLWSFHHSHKLMHYLLPSAAVLNDLQGNASRDVFAYGRPDEWSPVDVSPIVDAPVLTAPGVLPRQPMLKADSSCFAKSVLGTAGICPGGILCHVSLHDEGLQAVVAHVRQRLQLPQPPPPKRSPPLVYFIQRAAKSRSFVNPQQLLDILRAFSGLDVRELRLEGATFKQQVQLFSEASMVVATHGNALGNMVWMPPGSAVLEYVGQDFRTQFFSSIAEERDMQWSQRWCEPDLLHVPLDEAEVDSALGRLQARPQLQWLVGENTRAALLAVQQRVNAQRYSIPAEVQLAQGPQGVINVTPNNTEQATCLFDSVLKDKVGFDPKDRHVFVPPSQFLRDIEQFLSEWYS